MAYIAKLTNEGGVKSLNRYISMLAGNDAYVGAAYESIATYSGNGSASSFTFSSIPTTYKHLQIRLIVRGVRAFSSEQLYIRLNGDSGNNYSYYYFTGNGSGGGGGSNANGNVYLVNEFPAGNETANIFSASIIDILDSNSTVKNSTFRSLSGYENNRNTSNYNGTVWYGGGYWANTAAITSLTVLSNGAFATGSSIALYGVK
jgi:hypothetical protein